MAKAFNLQDQYQQYLERVGLVEANLTPIQASELKRAFFAGISTMLVLMQNELPALPEMAAVHQIQNMVKQADNFWKNEVENGLNKN